MYKDWLLNSDINEALKVLLKSSDRHNYEDCDGVLKKKYKGLEEKIKDKLSHFGFNKFFDFGSEEISIWRGNQVDTFFANLVVRHRTFVFLYKPQLKYSIFTLTTGAHHQLIFAVMHEGKLTHLFYFNSLGASNENDFKLIKQGLKMRNDAHDVKVFRNNNKPQRDGYTCGHQFIIAAYTLVHYIEEIRQECSTDKNVDFCTRVTEKLQDMQINSASYFKVFDDKKAEVVCELIDKALQLSKEFSAKKATLLSKDGRKNPGELRFLYSKEERENFVKGTELEHLYQNVNDTNAGSGAFFDGYSTESKSKNKNKTGQSSKEKEVEPLISDGKNNKNDGNNDEDKCMCCTLS